MSVLALDCDDAPASRAASEAMTRRVDAEGLIRRIVAAQDRAAFETLFLTFAPKVKTYLMLLGMAPERAEDLAQETLLTVWRRAAHFDPARASLGGWMFAIARNLRIDALRRERSAVNYALRIRESGEVEPAAHTALEAGEAAARLRQALAGLPPDQMEIVRMSYFEDKPHTKIASELGLPLGTVKSRLRLALVRLRAVVGELP